MKIYEILAEDPEEYTNEDTRLDSKCWKGYKKQGTKMKGDTRVNNCVKVSEDATAGATSAANIATVVNPHIAIGKAIGKKSYTGTPGKSGTKAPKPPIVKQPKNSDGTAKNGLDSNNLFGGPSATIKR